VVIFFGGVPNSHGVLGFHYWKHPGAVNEYLVSGNTGRFLAVWSAICKSALAFVFAPELLITTAGEVKSPRRNIPKAATRFAWRLIFFYVLS
jgi:amino acid transporter